MNCEEVQGRLTEAALAQSAAEPDDLAHAGECTLCDRHTHFLEALAATLDDSTAPSLGPSALARCRERTLRTLRAHEVPIGIGSDLIRAIALALLTLPLVIAHALAVAQGASLLLSPILPELALAWLGLVYFGSLALAVGVIYGSIPLLVARGRIAQRPRDE